MRPTPSIASTLSLPLTTSFAGAQTLWWPSASPSPPSVVLLFIPGNPGLSSFYIDFLHTIYTALSSSSVEILSVSHRGHAPLPSIGRNPIWGENSTNAFQAAKGYGCSLTDQLRHKIAVLDAVNRAYNPQGFEQRKTKVVLVGHSIGAWIATEVMKARPESVDGMHLLFPTLAWIGRTGNARKLGMLVNGVTTRFVLPLPLLVFSLIPLWMLVLVIRVVTGQPKAAALATAELLTTPGAVSNALTMAAEEFRTVQGLTPTTISAISKFTNTEKNGKVRTYWASEDTDAWAPGWIRSQVETSLSLHRVHLPPSLGLGLDHTSSNGASSGKGKRSHMRTRSFSVSEYRSSPGSIPDLRNAKAVRRANGEIVIEALVVDSDSSPSDDEETSSTTRNNNNSGNNSSSTGMSYAFGRNNATTTHCKVGMPHAFCLNHSEDMAKIVAAWIKVDHLANDSNGDKEKEK